LRHYLKFKGKEEVITKFIGPPRKSYDTLGHSKHGCCEIDKFEFGLVKEWLQIVTNMGYWI